MAECTAEEYDLEEGEEPNDTSITTPKILAENHKETPETPTTPHVIQTGKTNTVCVTGFVWGTEGKECKIDELNNNEETHLKVVEDGNVCDENGNISKTGRKNVGSIEVVGTRINSTEDLHFFRDTEAGFVSIGQCCQLIKININEAIKLGNLTANVDDNLISLIWQGDSDTEVNTEWKIEFLNQQDDELLTKRIMELLQGEELKQLRELVIELNERHKAKLRHISRGCIRLTLSHKDLKSAEKAISDQQEIFKIVEKILFMKLNIPRDKIKWKCQISSADVDKEKEKNAQRDNMERPKKLKSKVVQKIAKVDSTESSRALMRSTSEFSPRLSELQLRPMLSLPSGSGFLPGIEEQYSGSTFKKADTGSTSRYQTNRRSRRGSLSSASPETSISMISLPDMVENDEVYEGYDITTESAPPIIETPIYVKIWGDDSKPLSQSLSSFSPDIAPTSAICLTDTPDDEESQLRDMIISNVRPDELKEGLVSVQNDRKILNRLLIFAAECSNVELVRALCESGSSPDTQNDNGMTPLHVACHLGQVEMVRYLLPIANPNCQDLDGDSPLHIAVRYRRQELVNLLLNTPTVDPSVMNNNEDSILHMAAKYGKTDILQNIISKSRELLYARNLAGQSPLHVAILFKKDSLARVLIEKMDDFSITDKNGSTCLELAVRHSSENVLSLMLENSANIETVNAKNPTLLHVAAELNKNEHAECLIGHGADINACLSDGKTALHVAASRDSLDVTRTLLEKGVIAMKPDKQNYTALHYAKTEQMKTLLEHRGCTTAKLSRCSIM